MRKREPSPLDVLEARVAQLSAALAILAPPLPAAREDEAGSGQPGVPPGRGDAIPLRHPPPPANDPRASGP